MKNSNVPVKSKGVLFFAFNTSTVDYVKIAERSARLAEHTLGLPTTIITDNDIENNFKNYRTGYAQGTNWRNGDRYRAYELTPYDETILLDSDYLVLDQSLATLLETTQDYQLIHHNTSPKQSMSGNMGALSQNYVWATAVVFKRSERSQLLFELVGKIQRNYTYYRKLYNLREGNFRNDYAFAIANNIISGYTTNRARSVPWSMLTIDELISSIDIIGSNLVVRQADTVHVIPKQNLHIMDKDYLLSDNYNQFVDTICNT
jgi:hypothetical protein